MTKQQNENLSDEQKHVLFDKGTEAPGSGKFLNHDEQGIYTCANCGNKIFDSNTKYESTEPGLIGWPSFDNAIKDSVKVEDDFSLGMQRKEVLCAKCGGHLGHVFDAGDSPTGTHYCINSVSLDFEKSK